MQTHPREHRQLIGCGFELPLEHADAWCHTGYDGDPPTTCAGYTTRLPEVVEASQARLFWSKGELRSFTGGAPPTEALNAGITRLEIAANAMQSWLNTPASKGGGGHG